MTRVKIDLNFEGYAWDDNENIPEAPGIYCIYEVKFDPNGQMESAKLIYIGQAQRGKNGNLKMRIQAHGRTDYVNSSRNIGGKRIPKVRYAYSYVDMSEKFGFSPHEIDVAEAALVFRMQPEKNEKLKDIYNQDDVQVSLSGKTKDLPKKPFKLNQGTTYEEYFGVDELSRWLNDLDNLLQD